LLLVSTSFSFENNQRGRGGQQQQTHNNSELLDVLSVCNMRRLVEFLV
jgi:hypothetical protein